MDARPIVAGRAMTELKLSLLNGTGINPLPANFKKNFLQLRRESLHSDHSSASAQY
jgi:hypothetical protein